MVEVLGGQVWLGEVDEAARAGAPGARGGRRACAGARRRTCVRSACRRRAPTSLRRRSQASRGRRSRTGASRSDWIVRAGASGLARRSCCGRSGRCGGRCHGANQSERNEGPQPAQPAQIAACDAYLRSRRQPGRPRNDDSAGRRAARRGRRGRGRRRLDPPRDRPCRLRRPAALPQRRGGGRDPPGAARPARPAARRRAGAGAGARRARGSGRARSTSTCSSTATRSVDEPGLAVPHPRLQERAVRARAARRARRRTSRSRTGARVRTCSGGLE